MGIRKLEQLYLEKIGEDLCIVFKTDKYKFRDILGRIDPGKLEQFASAACKAADIYPAQAQKPFRIALLE